MWPESEKTQDLLEGVANGDAEAVNRLMDRHRESLRRLIQMRLDKAIAGRVDASDVVQDVLLEASGRLNDFVANPSMPFHLWLRQLAQDRMIDLHRRHRGAQKRSVDREQALNVAGMDRSSINLDAVLRDGELTPAAANIRKELEERFLLALNQLSEEDREIILMRHYEHLGNSEVAQALGVTPPAAGMRYLRALRKLRTVLGEEASGEGVE